MLNWGLAGCKPQTIKILEATIAENLKPSFIATMPGMPGKETNFLHDAAKTIDAQFVVSNDLFEHKKLLESLDVLIVCRYNLLIQEVLSSPRFGTVNIHSSLLPYYRGVHPVSWALIRGEEQTGVSLHHIDNGIDTGPVLLQGQCRIKDEHDIWSLTDELNSLSAELLVALLKSVTENKMLGQGAPQEKNNYFYARRRKALDGKINWNMRARDVFNLIRALQAPLPFAYSLTTTGQKITVESCLIVSENENDMNEPGTVLAVKNNSYLIQCAEGIVEIITVDKLIPGTCLA